ncbi:MAG: sporulation transcription factor Spo0A [Clostridia bacterium]|nr:sporulation transcription factor Spo0A [Clostridia bacterium]
MKAKILIADGNQSYIASMQEFLTAQDNVALVDIANDGAEALSALRRERYDVLVTDLILPHMDGFYVLEQLRSSTINSPSAIIIVSALRHEDMVRRACSLGAKYYMVKPVEPETLYKRINELIEATSVPEKSQTCAFSSSPRTLDEKITSIFLTIGIPAHIKGYHYLRCAVRMIYAHPDMINRITKELYPGIAMQFQTSPSKVERAIRHAIEVAWTRGKIENINQLFGYNIYNKNDKPTNGEFIALIADKLLIEDARDRNYRVDVLKFDATPVSK